MARWAGAFAFPIEAGIGGMLEAWTPISSGWIWAGVTFIGALGLGLGFWWDRKKRRGSEIRIDDTTTYREQPDGSRVVTTTKLVRPERAAGKASATFQPAPPARLTHEKVRERMEEAARQLRGDNG